MQRVVLSGLAAGAAALLAALAPVAHGQGGTVSLREASAPAGALTVQATIAGIDRLRDWDRLIDRMRRDGELRVRRVREDALLPGRTHERLDQYHRGVRVVGGDIARQADANGLTLSVFGTVYDELDADPEPTLTAARADAIVEQASGGTTRPGLAPELVFLPQPDGAMRLVYQAYAFTDEDVILYSVDARSGAIVDRASAVRRQSTVGRGTGVLGDLKKVSAEAFSGTFLASDLLRPPDIITFDMRGDIARAIALRGGLIPFSVSDVASDSDNTWTDGANVDAHVYLGWVYDYLFKAFNRRGLDNNDVRIYALTHPLRREDVLSVPQSIWGLYGTNAFWCTVCGPDGRGLMVFGDGLPPNLRLDGQSYDYLAGALDVVGHELAHGLTAYTWGAGFGNQPGALNEAYSDIIGTSVEFFFQQAGSGSQRAEYLIGEDVISGAIRSLADPRAFGNADNYELGLIDPSNPGRFIYFNSGIATHAFYLAIEGGTNRTSGRSVQGVGSANRLQVERAFYRGFTSFLTSNATFIQARAATTLAAIELYGANSATTNAIIQAWNAVSVP